MHGAVQVLLSPSGIAGEHAGAVQLTAAGEVQVGAHVLGQRGVRGQADGVDVRGVLGDAHEGDLAVLQGHHAVRVLLGPEVEQVHQVAGSLGQGAARCLHLQLQPAAAPPYTQQQ